jgi:hypothetical protein
VALAESEGRARPGAGGGGGNYNPYYQPKPTQNRPQYRPTQRPYGQNRPQQQQYRPTQRPTQYRPTQRPTTRRTTTRRIITTPEPTTLEPTTTTTVVTTTTELVTEPAPVQKVVEVVEAASAIEVSPFDTDEDDGRKKKNNNNYSGGNNNNNNNNSPSYNNNNGGGNNNNDGGSNYNGGSVYGDPHFMVVTKGQEALCFDFQPPAGATMNLLLDPETLLSVSADAAARGNGKTFMTKIHFQSPGGAKLEFDDEGVHLSGLNVDPTDKHPVTGHVEYGDIVFVERWTEDKMHENTKIEIKDGPSFVIKGSVKKQSLSFACTDGEGLSEKSRGIIGRFMHDGAYMVNDTGDVNEEGNKLGQITVGGMSVEAVNEKFHHSSHCWVIQEQDVTSLIFNSL